MTGMIRLILVIAIAVLLIVIGEHYGVITIAPHLFTLKY